jgi:uncharacterized protein
MELLYTSDLHGSGHHYEQLLTLLAERPCDVLVLGGDILPDGDRGMPYRSVCTYIRVNFRDFLRRAHDINNDLLILSIFGNHDWMFSIDEFSRLQDESLLTMLDHEKLYEVGGLSFLGLSYCPPAPYWIKDFERRDLDTDVPSEFGGYAWSEQGKSIVPVVGREYFAAHDSLEQMLQRAPVPAGPFVLVSHAPPSNSNLDVLLGGMHVGSRAVRQFIETKRPILSLHGHLHESPLESGHFTEDLKGCLCVNAGQDHARLCAIYWSSSQPREIEHSLGWPR